MIGTANDSEQRYLKSGLRTECGTRYTDLPVFKSEIMPLVKCPSCGKEAEYAGNEFRPFCSERCKMIDFGAWADEEFALPSQTESLTEEDVDKIEKALKEKAENNIWK